MIEEDEEIVFDVFSSVHPFLNAPSDLKEEIEDLLKESSNLDEFESNFEELTSNTEDPSMKADCRIFLNKFRSR